MKSILPVLRVSIILLFIISLLPNKSLASETNMVKIPGTIMEIPGLLSIAGSDTHLYALSSSDGLIVFRAHTDSLQWLYSAEGMQRRGNQLQADIRFAYLTGNDNRLTIIEPTSVLGVYSSTMLPAKPGPITRIGNHLYFGMDIPGLFRLSLETPDSVDIDPKPVAPSVIGDRIVIDVVSTGRQLLVLSASGELHQFLINDEELVHQRSFAYDVNLKNILIIENALFVTDDTGRLYEISGRGELFNRVIFPQAVKSVIKKNNYFIGRTDDGRIFGAKPDERARIFRNDGRASNLMAVSKNTVWVSEYQLLSAVQLRTAAVSEREVSPQSGRSVSSGEFALKSINNQIIPFPRALLLPVETTGDVSPDEIQFQVRGVSNATVRDQGLYWQPGSRDIGENTLTIIATTLDGKVDSTSFVVDVRAFNAPPRFSPVRPLSIPVGERFELPVRATDPDGSSPDLIRYLGVNLPDGATINERSGLIIWTPTRRQTGTHEFQVIATDQYSSAASLNVTINVLEISR